MTVTFPLSKDYFAGGRRLTPASGVDGERLVDALNQLATVNTNDDTRLDDLESNDEEQTTAIEGLQAGSTNLEVLAVNGTIAATSANVLLSTGSGTVTATLPAAATAGVGREIFVTRAGANNGTVQRAGSDTIGAAGTSITLAADGDGVTLVAVTTSRWAIKAQVTA